MAGTTSYKGKHPADLAEDGSAGPALLLSSSLPSSSSSSSSIAPVPDTSSSKLRALKRQTSATSPLNHGCVNVENETTLGFTEGIHAHPSSRGQHGEIRDECLEITDPHAGHGRQVSCQSEAATTVDKTMLDADRCPLLDLPLELIDSILTHLSAIDLSSISATCRKLHTQAVADLHWLRCVQENVPGLTLSTPGPCESFRELYMAHDPAWFLPKYKIWFCDRDLMGKLVIVRFDPRRGCIEGYQLLAVSHKHTFEEWSADSDVIIYGFEPQVKLHLEKPVLQLNVRDGHEFRRRVARAGANRFAAEVPMMREDRTDLMFSNFLFTRPMDVEAADAKLVLEYPYDHVWPPPAVPATQHVSGARSVQAAENILPRHAPESRSEISDHTFRIRQWMEMPGTPSPSSLMGGQAGSLPESFNGLVHALNTLNSVLNGSSMTLVDAGGIHIGEEVITYSTLDPVLYTPTESKPWRGIWVGDYSTHGCEFLLINQPDDAATTDAELGLARGPDESEEAWERRRREARMYRGRLEAIKLTGDPNVPRGEYSFVADDLGPGGFVATASEPPFAGARVVKSKGHMAGTGFVRDKYVESQLVLIGPDRIAQYWIGFGHISFFERVQVDQLLVPP
ncbi:hypothetical protein E4U42_004592 [Claviceps africana]|uniref:F-box domain-containing protein n=1 Tax=Claviceps africana TaxID=83212 RepID=A0A8K0JCI9_9HYPO|nr:hypothetical protein E4U42_004592 [Claviceps africana]